MADHMTAEQLRADFEPWADRERFVLTIVRGIYADELTRAAFAGYCAARLSGMAAGTWQPIETAPRDGRDYITTDGRSSGIENHPTGRMPGRWSKENDGQWSGYASRPINYAPKWWCEIPAAPEPPHV